MDEGYGQINSVQGAEMALSLTANTGTGSRDWWFIFTYYGKWTKWRQAAIETMGQNNLVLFQIYTCSNKNMANVLMRRN